MNNQENIEKIKSLLESSDESSNILGLELMKSEGIECILIDKGYPVYKKRDINLYHSRITLKQYLTSKILERSEI